MTNIEKWHLARNLLDAKKALDSLWYISKHITDLYDVRGLCYNSRSDYYINVCAVLDKSICSNGKKRNIVETDSVVKRVYTERDKHYAHKDKGYKPSFPYSSLDAEAISLQDELRHIRKICSNYLPDVLTLDFVCYDGRLFRQIEKINPADEERINSQKYPSYNKSFISERQKAISHKILYDVDDLKGLSEEEKSKYGVVCENGLTFEEGVQKRQDFCVKFNIMSNTTCWYCVNEPEWKRLLFFREIGVFDKFGRIDVTKIPQNLL